jgi:hypothetical protein
VFITATTPHQSDPFTRFLDPDQFAALQGATTGELTGVGLEIAPGKAPGGESGKEPVVRRPHAPSTIIDSPIAFSLATTRMCVCPGGGCSCCGWPCRPGRHSTRGHPGLRG